MPKTPQRNEAGWLPLLEQVLTECPSLPRAACVGRHDLFDAALHPEPQADPVPAQVAAERICRHCPHTTSCPDSLAARTHQEVA